MTGRGRRLPPPTATEPPKALVAPDRGFERRRVFRLESPGRRREDRQRAIAAGRTPSARIRVAVGCGAALFRTVLSDFLAHTPDLEVVRWSHGSETRAVPRAAPPHVVIVDFGLFLRASERADAPAPRCPTLVLATPDHAEQLPMALRFGAWGIMFHDADPGQLLALIRAAAAGGSWEEQAYASAILRSLRTGSTRVADGRAGPLLSRRERQLIAEVAAGASNGDIAVTLGLRPQTVKNRLSAIFDKLGVSSRLELALYAWQHRLAERPRDPPPLRR